MSFRRPATSARCCPDVDPKLARRRTVFAVGKSVTDELADRISTSVFISVLFGLLCPRVLLLDFSNSISTKTDGLVKKPGDSESCAACFFLISHKRRCQNCVQTISKLNFIWVSMVSE